MTWGLAVWETGSGLGFMAFAVGLLSGFAVLWFGRSKRPLPLQFIAAFSCLAGIFLGKYMTFYHFSLQELVSRYGNDAAAQISPWSTAMWRAYWDNLHLVIRGPDLAWIFLALFAAWAVPHGGTAMYNHLAKLEK